MAGATTGMHGMANKKVIRINASRNEFEVKCKRCGGRGEVKAPVPTLDGYDLEDCPDCNGKGEATPRNMQIELTKIKIVLCALWDSQPHPDAQEIIMEFKRDVHNIMSGH